jgi:hypothetical protein
MARDSLKALGLSEHEAVIACHTDKEHHHVHVVVNTVHPYTGKTAPMKFSKLEFSRWAEAYEKEHGIHCEERIKNNEKRREIAREREEERAGAALAILTGKQPQQPAPFEPVNDNSANRRRWFERKEVVDKMKALRAALDQDHKGQRAETWAAQVRERDQLDRTTRAALDTARDTVRDQFKGQWNTLYRSQMREARHLSAIATHPLERAVYVFQNRDRLGANGKSLTLRRMIPLILSGRKLNQTVVQMHDRQRRSLARSEKAVTKQSTERVWQNHRAAFHALRDRQATERAAEKSHQIAERGGITFARAKDTLIQDADRHAAERAAVRIERQPKAPLVEPRRSDKAADHVPTAPQPRLDARAALMAKSEMAKEKLPLAPLVKPAPVMRPDASAMLMRSPDLNAAPPIAPTKQHPQPPQPRAHQVAAPFKEAATPPRSELDAAFKQAAAPKQPTAKPELSADETIRREFAKWAKTRHRGDFERER